MTGRIKIGPLLLRSDDGIVVKEARKKDGGMVGSKEDTAVKAVKGLGGRSSRDGLKWPPFYWPSVCTRKLTLAPIIRLPFACVAHQYVKEGSQKVKGRRATVGGLCFL